MSERRTFGTRKPAVSGADFDFFDLTVRFNPEFGELGLIDFLEAANAVDVDDPSSMVILKTALRECVHADDFDAFWKTAKRERQEVEDLMGILYAAVEVATARPTGRPSDSSDGSPSMSVNSAAGSSSLVIDRLVSKGRPDLALIVTQAQDYRASA